MRSTLSSPIPSFGRMESMEEGSAGLQGGDMQARDGIVASTSGAQEEKKLGHSEHDSRTRRRGRGRGRGRGRVAEVGEIIGQNIDGKSKRNRGAGSGGEDALVESEKKSRRGRGRGRGRGAVVLGGEEIEESSVGVSTRESLPDRREAPAAFCKTRQARARETVGRVSMVQGGEMVTGRAKFRERGRGRSRGVQKQMGSGNVSDGAGSKYKGLEEGGVNLPENILEIRAKWLTEITVIPDWKSYYQPPLAPRELHFASTVDEEPIVTTLPLFKAAVVPNGASAGERIADKTCNDVILNAGGSVWALDWCPKRPSWPLCHLDSEGKPTDVPTFIAVGTHPFDYPYTRLGETLSGRGLLQIWGIDFSACACLPSDKSTDPGRGMKSWATICCAGQTVVQNNVNQDLNPSGVETFGNLMEQSEDGCDQLRKENEKNYLDADENSGATKLQFRSKEAKGNDFPDHMAPRTSLEEATHRKQKMPVSSVGNAQLPGMVLGLVHDGLLAWDAKWRPVCADLDEKSREREILRLGYLALVLGDGSVQVFDIPLPGMLDVGTLFVRMKPVLRCSNLRCGSQKSIPLALEWSRWDPYDLLLVGCHDGSVALWKISPSAPPGQETRPLLSFVADAFPIRTVAWAPDGSGSGGKSLIATAGHSGYVRFWDIRDPYRPIWDLQVSRGWIFGLDWLANPKCMLLCMDDGTLRLLNLKNSAPESLATGNTLGGIQTQNLHSYLCSSSTIWGIQACRSQNVVAYCGADGTVLQFQLTEKAIEKDATRNRAPHFLIGALAAESETAPLVILPQQRKDPVHMKKSLTEWSNTPRSKRGFLSTMNQALRATGGPLVPRMRQISGRAANGKAVKAFKDFPQVFQAKEELDSSTAQKEDVLGEDTVQGEFLLPAEEYPLKIVSIHRVRWNCNVAQGEWIAYGGASGIVRCQRVIY